MNNMKFEFVELVKKAEKIAKKVAKTPGAHVYVELDENGAHVYSVLGSHDYSFKEFVEKFGE